MEFQPVTGHKKRVLVTGSSGLVGRELTGQLLCGDHEITAIYNKNPLPGFPGLKKFQCNVLDVVGLSEVMQGMDEVYHCAGFISYNPRHRRELFKINVEGTANVVNAALDAGVKKMVHVSSVAALGRTKQKESVNEAMVWNKQSSKGNYAESKYLGELEVWRGIGEGLKAVIVNPAIILGAGDWNESSSQIFRSVYNEFPWYSDGIGGFVGVKDVAKAMIQLMESDVCNQRFILSAADKSYGEVFELIAKAFGKKPPHKKVTPLLAALIWRIEAIKGWLMGIDPLVTRETASTALAKLSFNNTKLYQFLPGFQYVPIEEIIKDTCTTLQQKLNNR